jgi:hypothetical protein
MDRDGPRRSGYPALLTPGAPLAAGTMLWVLWNPVVRLIAVATPTAVGGLLVPMAQWGLTVLGGVWAMVLLAQQASVAGIRGGRVSWALVAVLSLALLIVAYIRQDSLLQRGLTFLSVGAALLLGVAGTRWNLSGSWLPGRRRPPRSGDRPSNDVLLGTEES